MPKGHAHPPREMRIKSWIDETGQFHPGFDFYVMQAQETLGNCYMAETLRGFSKWDWRQEVLPDGRGSTYHIYEDLDRIWLELPKQYYDREQAILQQMDDGARHGIVKDFIRRYNCKPSEAEIVVWVNPSDHTWRLTIRKRAGSGEVRTASGIVLSLSGRVCTSPGADPSTSTLAQISQLDI